MLTTWPSKTVLFCSVQCTASLNFVSQRQTCDDRLAQVLCLKVLGMANLRRRRTLQLRLESCSFTGIAKNVSVGKVH